ncbi:MAG TPA: LysR family transcriptional regulator [Rhodopila sp.]|uniref:LysR family transcriptional regulator n=1 Tax=Rhodopila sp. TaxID=2480087 RepID=UPI002CE17ED1|nr:LysR family transcriptional regulator [Rhodopila sp.]HVY16502.1 LysR family transcriptional regulator [Rhodopila sp.]
MIDPVLLRTFLAVVQSSSFSEAGRSLGLGQPAVSQQIRRLEDQVSCRLFVRDTHSVALTPDGEAMVAFAEAILDANARAESYFRGARGRARLRFGASEDFVVSRLPEVLRDFTRGHPLVDLELTVGLSGWLNARLDDGELDLVLAKRPDGDDRGRLVWRDRLVWVGAPGTRIDPKEPIPLILYPPPSITREQVLRVLEQTRGTWRIACTSSSLTGLRAAALSGLGVLVLARGLIPQGLDELDDDTLPDLGEVEFVLRSAGRSLRAPARQLSDAILAYGETLLEPGATPAGAGT